MAGKWWDESWNPVTGCTAVSEGCAHCYAKAMHERFFQSTKFEKVVLHPERLDKPSRMKAGKIIFVDSASDLFHEDVPFSFIDQVLKVIRDNPQHTFVVLTKRAERMHYYFSKFLSSKQTPENMWLGVTCENQARADERIPLLLKAPVNHRFVSVEPMLGAVELSEWANVHSPLQLVICGGESGTGARPMQPDWARGVRDQCVAAGVPFFFKQWGEWAPVSFDEDIPHTIVENDVRMARIGITRVGRLLDGREWNELPWRKSVEKLVDDQPAEVQLALTSVLSRDEVEGAYKEEVE